MDRIAAVALLLLLPGCASPPAKADVTFLKSEVFSDRIVLTWDVEWTPGIVSEPITFTVERLEDGRWTRVAVVPGTYAEDALPAAEVVSYRVSSSLGESRTLEVRTSPIFRLAFSPVSDSEVSITIHQRHPVYGWISLTATQKVGDRIGWWTELGDYTSTHDTYDFEREAKIVATWDTGCLLTACRPSVILICRAEWDSRHEQKGCIEQSRRRVWELEYVDAQKRTVRIRVPRLSLPRGWMLEEDAVNRRCPFHQKYPDEPFMTSGAERASEARKLLAQADRLWEAGESSPAIAAYGKMIREYKETPAVKENWSRILRRAEQE